MVFGHRLVFKVRILEQASDRVKAITGSLRDQRLLSNDALSPLFEAVIEATEEAIINSLFRATTTSGRGHTVEALPIDRTIEVLRRYNLIR